MKTTNQSFPGNSKKIKAYLGQISSGKVISDKARIVSLMAKGPVTLDTLVLHGFKIQTAAGRLSELEDEGIVYKVDTHNNDMSWFHLEDDELMQDKRMAERKSIKKEQYFIRGLANGFITQDQFNHLTA